MKQRQTWAIAWLVCCGWFLTGTGCGPDQQSPAKASESESVSWEEHLRRRRDTIDRHFRDFWELYHRDSAFQQSRTRFPLPCDSMGTQVEWPATRMPFFSGEIPVYLSVSIPDVKPLDRQWITVFEHRKHRQQSYEFRKTGGAWKLHACTLRPIEDSTEAFLPVLARFLTDSLFARERTLFPLACFSFNSVEETWFPHSTLTRTDSGTTVRVAAADWRDLAYPLPEGRVEIFAPVSVIASDSVAVGVSVAETCWADELFFRKTSGRWMLVKMVSD